MDSDAIKKILAHGGEINMPIKNRSLDEWYNDGVSIHQNRNGKYTIGLPQHQWVDKDTLEEAFELFMPYCDNMGAVQQYVYMKHNIGDADLLSTEVLQKMVDEELQERRDKVAKKLPSLRDLFEMARKAGHDSLGIANDPESLKVLRRVAERRGDTKGVMELDKCIKDLEEQD
jgi:hypothetical protein